MNNDRYVRLTTMSHPGPIDNYQCRMFRCVLSSLRCFPHVRVCTLRCQRYLCPHGMLGYSSVRISEFWVKASRYFGHSPEAEMAAEPFFPISRKLSQSLLGGAKRRKECQGEKARVHRQIWGWSRDFESGRLQQVGPGEHCSKRSTRDHNCQVSEAS